MPPRPPATKWAVPGSLTLEVVSDRPAGPAGGISPRGIGDRWVAGRHPPLCPKPTVMPESTCPVRYGQPTWGSLKGLSLPHSDSEPLHQLTSLPWNRRISILRYTR